MLQDFKVPILLGTEKFWNFYMKFFNHACIAYYYAGFFKKTLKVDIKS